MLDAVSLQLSKPAAMKDLRIAWPPASTAKCHANHDSDKGTPMHTAMTNVQPRTEEHAQLRSPAIICFCHLRWNFVYQRPQHLLTRCQKLVDVHIWEEPIFEDIGVSALARSIGRGG